MQVRICANISTNKHKYTHIPHAWIAHSLPLNPTYTPMYTILMVVTIDSHALTPVTVILTFYTFN